MAVFDLGAVVFATNDEARFPLLARDILTRGDVWFPQLNGVVYQNKPLLLAWLIALVSWPIGQVTALTSLVPSILAALALALVVYAAARDMFGADAGRYAGLVVATSQGFVIHARQAMPDMLLTLFVTVALWQGWRLTRGRPRAWLGFYGATGLAFWTKGPAGLLPLLPLVVWAPVEDRGHRLASLGVRRGLALLAALVAPWPLIGLLGQPSGLQAAVVNDQMAWYLRRAGSGSALVAPLQNAFGILFPWVLLTPLIVVQAVRALRGRGGERDTVQLLLTWAAVTFVAVALSAQQRVRYYLPLLTPLAAAGAYRADTRRPTTEEFGRLEARVRPLAGANGAVIAWDVADLPLNFYLRRPVLEVHTREGLSRAFDGHAAVAVVGERVVQSADNPAGVTVLWRATLGARGVAVLAPER